MRKKPVATRKTKADLSRDELLILEDKVLPAARRHINEFGKESTLYEHGQKTLEYWNEWDFENERPM